MFHSLLVIYSLSKYGRDFKAKYFYLLILTGNNVKYLGPKINSHKVLKTMSKNNVLKKYLR